MKDCTLIAPARVRHIADGFRESALNDAKSVLHLKAAILSRSPAQAEHRATVGLCKHMSNTPLISDEFNLAKLRRLDRLTGSCRRVKRQC